MDRKDLVESNLIRYFYADSKVDEVKNRIIALDTTMGMKSPKFSSEPSGYTGTHDEKLLDYSIKKAKLDDELKSLENEKRVYFNILHLYELEETDITFLTLIYKEKKKYEEIAKIMFYTDKSYVSRKRKNVLERLSKYV